MLTKRNVEWLGWRPDLPDVRDREYSMPRALAGEVKAPATLPPFARPQKREVSRHGVLDQGPTGSCTGHGVGLIVSVERNVTKRSPYFLYWMGRQAIGETDRDEGAYIRDVIKAANDVGAPVYSKWPSVSENLFADPSDAADRDAAKRRVFSYHRLDDDSGEIDRGQMYRSCLAGGHLFTIGFAVYSNIDDAMVSRFGILGWPAGRFEGGHCVAVTGYDDNFRESEWGKWARDNGFPEYKIPERVYECVNSWGSDWGRDGRFAIDATYLEHPYLADDAWTVRGFADERK